MKLTYKDIKNELERRSENTRYFTKAFLKTYLQAREARKKAIEENAEDAYIIRPEAPITLYKSLDPIYKSDFYSKNSCAYCEFLAIVYGHKIIV